MDPGGSTTLILLLVEYYMKTNNVIVLQDEFSLDPIVVTMMSCKISFLLFDKMRKLR